MICPSCGNETIPSTFCSSCGAQLQKRATAYRDVRYDTTTLYGLFKNEYERYRPYKQVVDEILVKQRSRDKHIEASKSKLPILVFALIGIFLAMVLIAAVSLGTTMMIATSGAAGVTEEQSALLRISWVVALAIALAVVLLGVKLFRTSQRKAAAKDEARISELQDSLANFHAQAEAPLLPLGLSNPYHIYNLSEIVRLGRARTINEAIEVYIEDTDMDRQILESENRANKIRNAALVMAGALAYKKLRDTGKYKIVIK